MSLSTCCRLLPSILRNVQHRTTLLTPVYNLGNNKICPVSKAAVQVRYIAQVEKTQDNNEKMRVYNGTLTPQIRVVKWFSLTTSLMGIVAQPLIYHEMANSDNIPLVIAACSFVGFFTFVTPFLLHLLTKKYITHLDYNTKTETYTAATLNFFCMSKELDFTTTDVKVPDVPGMFTTFLAKGKPLFLDPKMFPNPVYYGKIMGYDKPIDLKLYETSDKDK